MREGERKRSRERGGQGNRERGIKGESERGIEVVREERERERGIEV